MKQTHRLAKFRALSGPDRWLLVQTFGWLALYKCLLIMLPFRMFYRESASIRSARHTVSNDRIRRVTWAIRVISSGIPLGFTCLVQALAARRLLGNHPDIQIYIGVQKSSKQAFAAHAWVTYQNQTILGEQADQTFKPILHWN